MRNHNEANEKQFKNTVIPLSELTECCSHGALQLPNTQRSFVNTEKYTSVHQEKIIVRVISSEAAQKFSIELKVPIAETRDCINSWNNSNSHALIYCACYTHFRERIMRAITKLELIESVEALSVYPAHSVGCGRICYFQDVEKKSSFPKTWYYDTKTNHRYSDMRQKDKPSACSKCTDYPNSVVQINENIENFMKIITGCTKRKSESPALTVDTEHITNTATHSASVDFATEKKACYNRMYSAQQMHTHEAQRVNYGFARIHSIYPIFSFESDIGTAIDSNPVSVHKTINIRGFPLPETFYSVAQFVTFFHAFGPITKIRLMHPKIYPQLTCDFAPSYGHMFIEYAHRAAALSALLYCYNYFALPGADARVYSTGIHAVIPRLIQKDGKPILGECRVRVSEARSAISRGHISDAIINESGIIVKPCDAFHSFFSHLKIEARQSIGFTGFHANPTVQKSIFFFDEEYSMKSHDISESENEAGKNREAFFHIEPAGDFGKEEKPLFLQRYVHRFLSGPSSIHWIAPECDMLYRSVNNMNQASHFTKEDIFASVLQNVSQEGANLVELLTLWIFDFSYFKKPLHQNGKREEDVLLTMCTEEDSFARFVTQVALHIITSSNFAYCVDFPLFYWTLSALSVYAADICSGPRFCKVYIDLLANIWLLA